MDYRKLIDFLNFMVVAYNETMANMGLDINLVLVQMARAFKEKAAHLIEKDFNLDIQGKDIKSIVESFIDRIKTTGICQRTELSELSDGELTIKMGDCILHQATQVFLKDKPPGFIPPSPIISILFAYLEEGTGKRCFIDKYEILPNENSTIFTIKLE
ncbi:MAG: hypothetical protein ACTSYF_09195 [Promethearchaeota archaeon]